MKKKDKTGNKGKKGKKKKEETTTSVLASAPPSDPATSSHSIGCVLPAPTGQ